MSAILGIDMGGTKTSVCLADEHGAILHKKRIPTNTAEGPERGMARIIDLALEVAESGKNLRAVGVAAPGPVSLERGMLLEPPNMPGWVNIPIVDTFRDAFDLPVYMNNDANACVLAEWMFGEFKGADNLVYLTMSTGLGAGIIVNGKILQGASDVGGEIGHHVLDINGPPCPCGQHGCLEIYCGGKNVADRLRERIVREKINTSILDEAGGDPDLIDFRAFVAAVEMGDAFALEAWDEYTERLAQGIGTVIQIVNPEAIVLGTIAIHAGDLVLKPLNEKLEKYAWSYGRDACTIAPSQLGEQIGDLSAIAVAMERN